MQPETLPLPPSFALSLSSVSYHLLPAAGAASSAREGVRKPGKEALSDLRLESDFFSPRELHDSIPLLGGKETFVALSLSILHRLIWALERGFHFRCNSFALRKIRIENVSLEQKSPCLWDLLLRGERREICPR